MLAQTTDAGADAPPVCVSDVRRRVRFSAQRWLWKHSSLAPVRGCGRKFMAGVSMVGLRVSDGPRGRRGGFAGLRTCGSVWTCPVCASKILSHRQGELQSAAEAWVKSGGRVAMFTTTVRHDRSQSIDTVWDGVSAAQHAMTSGRAHQREKIRYGVCSDEVVETCDVASCGAVYTCSAKICTADTDRGRAHRSKCKAGQPTARALAHAPVCRLGEPVSAVLPWARVVEVTLGDNGWHVHQHMAVFLPGGSTDADMWALYDAFWTRWAAGATAAGLDGSRRVNYPRWVDSSAALGDYFTKQEYSGPEVLGLEMGRPDLKSGRFGGRTPFELLADVIDNAPDDLPLWHAFEQGSRGRRQMTWAHGARAIFEQLGAFTEPEKSDEDVAAQEVGTVDDTRAWLPHAAWVKVCRTPRLRADLLEAFERSDPDGFAVLDAHGLLYERART